MLPLLRTCIWKGKTNFKNSLSNIELLRCLNKGWKLLMWNNFIRDEKYCWKPLTSMIRIPIVYLRLRLRLPPIVNRQRGLDRSQTARTVAASVCVESSSWELRSLGASTGQLQGPFDAQKSNDIRSTIIKDSVNLISACQQRFDIEQLDITTD